MIYFLNYYWWHPYIYKISNNFTFEAHANISYFRKWQNNIINFDHLFFLQEVKMRYSMRNEQREEGEKAKLISPATDFSPLQTEL